MLPSPAAVGQFRLLVFTNFFIIMSCKELHVFFANLAYIPHMREKYSPFHLLKQKSTYRKSIFLTIVSTIFSKLKVIKYNFGGVIFEVIEAA